MYSIYVKLSIFNNYWIGVQNGVFVIYSLTLDIPQLKSILVFFSIQCDVPLFLFNVNLIIMLGNLSMHLDIMMWWWSAGNINQARGHHSLRYVLLWRRCSMVHLVEMRIMMTNMVQGNYIMSQSESRYEKAELSLILEHIVSILVNIYFLHDKWMLFSKYYITLHLIDL